MRVGLVSVLKIFILNLEGSKHCFIVFICAKIEVFDYCLDSVTTLCRRIWMSFFDTEEVHAVMPDKVAPCGMLPPGFRLHVESHEAIFLFLSHQVPMLRETPFGGIPLGKDRGPEDLWSAGPGSSVKSRL